MAGGLIQLVATGYQDEYLINKPDITYFKMATDYSWFILCYMVCLTPICPAAVQFTWG